MTGEAGRFLSLAEVEARIAELRQQIAYGYEAWCLARGALQELEFVKRRILEPDPVEAPPAKASESESWQPPSDLPLGLSTSEAGAAPSAEPVST